MISKQRQKKNYGSKCFSQYAIWRLNWFCSCRCSRTWTNRTKQGYDKEFSTAVTATSALQGAIIPPSIPAVLIASVTGISVGGLFIGSVIPGIMVDLRAMFVVHIILLRRNYPVENKKYTLKEVINIFFISYSCTFYYCSNFR